MLEQNKIKEVQNLNTQITTSSVTEKNPHKVLFKPQGILAFVHSILPKGGILKFEKTGRYACACFNNTIDFNNFKTALAHITTA